MAVTNLLANPIVIAGSITGYKAQTASALGTLRTLLVRRLYWVNPASVGDTITIGDPVSGITLATMRCEYANVSEILDWESNPRVWSDFSIDSFPSGVLYIETV